MNLVRRIASLCLTTAVAVAFVATLSSSASAFSLRSPQVVFNSFALQGYLTNVVGESINTNTDQLDAQSFQSSVSGNATFTLQIELTSSFSGSNDIGIYNALSPPSPAPTQYLLFPGGATAGWFVTCHFSSSGNLLVYLFDQNGTLQGLTSYSGVDRNHFGFYLDGPAGLWYSQDARNGVVRAQVLTYAGTGRNYGDWWECFEDQPYNTQFSDFNDAVLLLQSVAPTPTNAKSWGTLKALYR
jgi:hypothetical protein